MRRLIFLGWLVWCGTQDPKPISIVILEPSGYGVCAGTTVPDRAVNVLLVCESGLKWIYPWELLRPYFMTKGV